RLEQQAGVKPAFFKDGTQSINHVHRVNRHLVNLVRIGKGRVKSRVDGLRLNRFIVNVDVDAQPVENPIAGSVGFDGPSVDVDFFTIGQVGRCFGDDDGLALFCLQESLPIADADVAGTELVVDELNLFPISHFQRLCAGLAAAYNAGEAHLLTYLL